MRLLSAWKSPLIPRRFPDPNHQVRLKLAQILIQSENRPAMGLKALAPLSDVQLPESLERNRQRLVAEAQRMQAEGNLELQDDSL